MFRIGAHVSISGGFPKAVEREVDLGGNCGQIFAGSPRGWRVSRPGDEEVEGFADLSEGMDVGPWAIHGTYLINLATPKDDLADKSIRTVQEELYVAEDLGVPFYVFHPGAHTGAGIARGIESVGRRLSELDVPDGVRVLLENTAGKGTTVGRNFEQLRKMIDISGLGSSDLGFCLDTCHLYAAGFDFTEEDELYEILDELDEEVGLDDLCLLHLNDSKHPMNSEKDEHEHIGEGHIGEKGFELFINHEELRDKPMVLETPVDDKGFAWNIEKCKELRKGE
ncbi:MAG: deoxyribonuclease IV [Candidatus Hadarchaeota archaeon]